MDKTNPDYYKQGKNEVIEITEHMDFCCGNACKYLLRAPYKENELLDLQKALWYVKRAKTHEKREWPAALDYKKVADFENPAVEAVVKQEFDKAIRLIEDRIKEVTLNEALAKIAKLEARLSRPRFDEFDYMFRGF